MTKDNAILNDSEILKVLYENMSQGFQICELIYNEEGEPFDYLILDVNHSTEKRLGLKREEIIGKRIKEIVPDIEPIWFIKYGGVIKTGKPVRFEMYNKSFSRWYDVLVTPLGKENIFCLLFLNITNSRNADAELRKVVAKYRKLFETSNDGFWWVDQQGCLLEANGGLCKMLGYSIEELLTKRWMDLVDEDFLEIGYQEWEKRKLGQSSCYEYKLKKKDGNSVWILAHGSPLLDENGKLIGILTVLKDITEIKQAEDAIRESERNKALIKELEKAHEQKNIFISTLSHELCNPLAATSMALKLLDRVPPGSIQEKKAREIIKRQTLQLTRLVSDLLDVTRIEKNKIELVMEDFEVIEMVKECLEEFKPHFIEKGVSLEAQYCEETYLKADAARFKQIIGNLLSNSLKFTHNGGTVRVILSSDKNTNHFVIKISDTGIGIAPEILSDLFKPFVQADNSFYRNNNGLGLGLSIIKGIVELHGGFVEAKSEGLGKGSEFIVKLPH